MSLFHFQGEKSGSKEILAMSKRVSTTYLDVDKENISLLSMFKELKVEFLTV